MAKKTDKIAADLQSGGRNHLLECVNLPAVLVDYQSMEIVKNNQQAALLFELPRKLSKFMLTELPPHFNKNIHHMEIQEFPAQLLNKKGERLRVMVKVLPYRQNEAPQLLFMFKILSPRNLTQVSYEYLQVKRMLDNLPVMLFAFDEDLNLILWNRECQRITGYSREEALNNPRMLADLFPDEAYRQKLIQEWSLRGDFRDWQITVVTKDGQERILSLNSQSSSALIPGFPAWAVGVDITRQKVIEAELRESEKKLRAGNLKLNRLAITDNLTQLYNRRYVIQRLREEMEKSRRYGLYFSCIMIDVDFFKKVNDRHGHLVGDYVLKRLGDLIKKNLRTSDIVGRYGGEEFLVIMPQTPAPKAELLAKRLCVLVDHTKFKTKKTSFSVTMSAGITYYPQKGINEVDELIAKADKALYQAKNAGRNCIKCCPRV